MFAGYGGLALAVQAVLGGDITWVIENDPNPAAVLAQNLPNTPNLGDVTQVDFTQARPVNVLCGGFPCTDLSHAGLRTGLIRSGPTQTRSGLWGNMLQAITTQQPDLVVIENVRGLLNAPADSNVEPCPWCLGDTTSSALRALGAVLADLADHGYDAAWYGLSAADMGAAHVRFRVFVFAWPRDLTTPWWATGHHCNPRNTGRAVGGHPGRPRSGAPGFIPGLAPADRVTLLPTPTGQDSAGSRNSSAWRAPTAGPHAVGDTLTDVIWRYAKYHDPRMPPPPPMHDWAEFTDAITRWENITGIPAPNPVAWNNNLPRIAPTFSEWLMGLPTGWVTNVPIPATAQLRMLGNGVLPVQAATALTMFLHDYQEGALTG